jgi:3-methylcrotonyl-CoA carboxylase alpha subunit
MLAKLIVWGEDRSVALGKLRSALSRYHLAGVATNLSLLTRIAHHPGFEAGSVDNTFIEENEAALTAATIDNTTLLVLASLDSVLARVPRSEAAAAQMKDLHSPWNATDTWRLNSRIYDALGFVIAGDERGVEIRVDEHEASSERFTVRVAKQEFRVSARTVEWREFDAGRGAVHRFEASVVGRTIELVSVLHDAQLTLFIEGETFRLASKDMAAGFEDEVTGEGAVVTPMPGKIIEVLVCEGDVVENGQVMIILEAMKMEHSVRAGGAAIVESLNVAVGDQIADGGTLLVLGVSADA